MSSLKIKNIIISDTRFNKTRDIIIESEHYPNVHIGDIFTCEEHFHLQVISISLEKDVLIPVGNWRYRKYTNENIIFPEYMAYRVFKLKMLSHMLEDEYFDFKNKNWEKRHE